MTAACWGVAPAHLGQVGLLLVQIGLRLVDGGLQISGVELGQDLTRDNLLTEADGQLVQLAAALEAQRYGGGIGDGPGGADGHLQGALFHRGGRIRGRLLVPREGIARDRDVGPARGHDGRQAEQ